MFKISERIQGFIKKQQWLALSMSCFCISIAQAAVKGTAPSLGEVSSNILGPASFLTGGLYKICYVIGVGLLVASVVQYKAHRRNPLQVHLIQPVLLFIFGLAIGLLPIIAQYSKAALSLQGY